MSRYRQSARIRKSDRKSQDIVNVNVPVTVAVQGDGGTGGAGGAGGATGTGGAGGSVVPINAAVALQAGFQNGHRNGIRDRDSEKVRQRVSKRKRKSSKRRRVTVVARRRRLARKRRRSC